MITALRLLFLAILASMLWVTTWAGLECPLFGVPRAVATHPWFIATLCDAYWGFVTFYVWVFSREASWSGRAAWFLAVMTLGNIAMASYCLAALFTCPPGAKLGDILVARRERPGLLGIALALLGTGVTIAAALGGRGHP